MDNKGSTEFKSIKVSDETHSRLAKLGTVSQTFEDVIKSLLDEHDRIEESKVKSKKWIRTNIIFIMMASYGPEQTIKGVSLRTYTSRPG